VSITVLETLLSTGGGGKTMKKSILKHFACFQQSPSKHLGSVCLSCCIQCCMGFCGAVFTRIPVFSGHTGEPHFQVKSHCRTCIWKLSKI